MRNAIHECAMNLPTDQFLRDHRRSIGIGRELKRDGLLRGVQLTRDQLQSQSLSIQVTALPLMDTRVHLPYLPVLLTG